MSPKWITPEQLSEQTGITTSRLTNQRHERVVFPQYPIAGTRAVVYKQEEVDAIIEAGRIGTVDEEPLPGMEQANKKPVAATTGQNTSL